MADSDEEDPRPSTSLTSQSGAHLSTAANMDQDLSEETQDFRFLSLLTSTRSASFASTASTSAATIPKRGEKDFEPNPTKSQQAALQASRQAMHDALSVQRVHSSRNWVVGYFTGLQSHRMASCPEGKTESGYRERRLDGYVVRVDQPRGTHFRTMGASDGWNRIWLRPEEALYLLERGSLDVRWGVPGDKDADGTTRSWDEGVENDKVEKGGIQEIDDVPALSDLPMSFQSAYAMCISYDDLTLARYTVFAGLRRSGYTVIRAPTWDDSSKHLSSQNDCQPRSASEEAQDTAFSPAVSAKQPPLSGWPSLRNALVKIFHFLFQRSPANSYIRPADSCPGLGPLVAPGLYRSYADIYRALSLVPFHDPLSRPQHASGNTRTPTSTSALPATTTPTSPFRIHYHVFKPTTPYRKSVPPPPDFHLSVIDARSQPTIPNLTEIGSLLEEMPIKDPKQDERLKKGRAEMRLKAGTRSVVLAVVDGGVVSFLRVAETGSGRERIYEGRSGGTKGGARTGRGGGGRGRGRGRGR
jgi:tRNA-splicing endonuclease subunit Sen54